MEALILILGSSSSQCSQKPILLLIDFVIEALCNYVGKSGPKNFL